MTADGALRKLLSCKEHQGLKLRERIAGRVGVEAAHGAAVPGVEGVEKIQSLSSPNLADKNAIRPHSQAGLQEVSSGDLAAPLRIGRSCLKPDHVGLLELEFADVLDADDAFVIGDEARAFRKVVFPEPVPPLTRMDCFISTATLRKWAAP